MNKKNYHVKKFEESYSQSREAQLIQYLNQRGAQVPKLISNHPTEKIIKMQYAGESLLGIINNNKITKKLNIIQLLKILRESINIGQEISKLEVWHFDLALRNFTLLESHELLSKSIFVIDFSAAVSPSFILQKPLWLRPDTKVHHGELIQALEKDWVNFFKKNSLSVPTIINNEFIIPLEKYNNYWNPQLHVQQLRNPVCVVAHSIGIMIYNFLINSSELTPEISKKKLEELKKITLGLKNLRSSIVAHHNINRLLESIDLTIQELEISSGVTPRPIISVKNNNATHSKNTKTSNSSRAIKENILALFILCFGFFVTNEAYTYHNIILGNVAYSIALLAIGISILYLFLSVITWKFFIFFKVFLRLESMMLFYYFFELLFHDTSWLFLILILISVISTFGFTIKYRNTFN